MSCERDLHVIIRSRALARKRVDDWKRLHSHASVTVSESFVARSDAFLSNHHRSPLSLHVANIANDDEHTLSDVDDIVQRASPLFVLRSPSGVAVLGGVSTFNTTTHSP